MFYLYKRCGHSKFTNPPRSNLTKEINDYCAKCKERRGSRKVQVKVVESSRMRIKSFFKKG